VHPFDFDHPQTVRSIERTLLQAIGRRRQILYGELAAGEEAGHGRELA
jgi:hypothetical protein